MKRLTTLVLCLTVAVAAHAQGVAIKGVGTFSCGQYMERRALNSASENRFLVSWVWGYMAGFNMESNRAIQPPLPDEPSALAYVDKHCRENPLDLVITATRALINALNPR